MKKVLALFVLVPSLSFAQAAPKRVHGFIDVSFGGAASAARAAQFVFLNSIYDETATFSADYAKPTSGMLFDLGGGILIAERFGVGVSSTANANRGTARLAATIPHPAFFNALGTGTAVSGPLLRSEGAVNLSLVFVPYATPVSHVRIMAGPSFFRYKADMVSDIYWQQSYSLGISHANSVSITRNDVTAVSGSSTGFHVAIDVDYFFTKMFGLGGLVRISRGSVTFTEPMSERTQRLTLGGMQVGGGLRVRF